MSRTKLGLLVVIFVGIAGQSLINPIVNALITEPTSEFLSSQATDSLGHGDALDDAHPRPFRHWANRLMSSQGQGQPLCV